MFIASTLKIRLLSYYVPLLKFILVGPFVLADSKQAELICVAMKNMRNSCCVTKEFVGDSNYLGVYHPLVHICINAYKSKD